MPEIPPAPAAETTPSSAASGPEEGFLQANSPKDLYTVECDGDLYFDMEEGVLVFMKNVRVRNPGLSMDCADHLKIYAEFVPKKPGDKKPSDVKKEKGKEENQTQVALPNGGNFDYNSIKTVAASGNVKASYTNKQGETSNAQAEKNHLQRQNRRNHPDGCPGHRHSGRHREKIRTRMLSFECTPTETCTAAAEPRLRSAT